jgi:PIN domain nuclease of toxin-antitoxin system
VNVVADTHALAWWLESNPKLSLIAKATLSRLDLTLLVPTMVLVEIKYMGAKLGITEYLATEFARLREACDVLILPLSEDVISRVSTNLNIHDAIIVASALAYSARTGETVQAITRDVRIAACGLVECVW